MNETVFVLDEDQDSRTALGELLEAEGLTPTLFGSAGDLLASIVNHPPALVIMDTPRPGTRGAALLTAFESDGRWQGLPVVVFTAWHDVDVPSSVDLEVVLKPDISGLLTALSAALATHSAPSRTTATSGEPART
jgi:FixJ family two-component response regulator